MIRKATLRDVKGMFRLINDQSKSGRILARAMSDLYTKVRDFSVYENEADKGLIGCGSLQVVWADLAEIRSLAVLTEYQGRGIGTKMIESLLDEASDMGIKQVFVLTYRDKLFERLGFERMDKNLLPHKIWADCIHCTKFPDCDEIALMKVLN